MARTTAAQVKTVIDVRAGDDLSAYIDTASAIVTAECTASGYAADLLELIERWLAAHCYASNRRRTAKQGVSGAADQSFDPIQTDLGLDNTTYGQMAMRLDFAGNLAAMNNSMKDLKKVMPLQGGTRVTWLGSDINGPRLP